MVLRNTVIFLTGLYLAILVWWFSLFFSGTTHGEVNNIFGLFWTLSSTLLYIFILKKIISLKRVVSQINLLTGLILVCCGALSWCIGNLIWVYYNLILNVEIPFPSQADLFFLLSYPTTLLGILNLKKVSGFRASFGSVLRKNLYLSVLIYALLMLVILIGKLTIKNLGLSINIVYVLMDIIIVLVGFVIWFRNYRSSSYSVISRLLILVGCFLLFLGDLGFFITIFTGTYYNAGFIDLIYISFNFFTILGLIKYLGDIYPPFSNEGFVYGPNFIIQLPYLRQISLNCIDLSLFSQLVMGFIFFIFSGFIIGV